MKPKKPKKTYPILAVRMSEKELAYIRRRAEESDVKFSRYVRETLAPSWAIVGK